MNEGADKQWFVAIVNHNAERRCAEKLIASGAVCYLPVQKELRIRKNGRKVLVDRIAIPSTVFIFCTEQERRQLVNLPFINRFMTNKAGKTDEMLSAPPAVIPAFQIERLKYMLGQSDIPVNIGSGKFKPGDRVRVVRGSLIGLEGEVSEMNPGKSELTVNIDFFGCARVIIDTDSLERIP